MEGIVPHIDNLDDVSRRAIGLIGADLLVREEWGEYYDPEDFLARDQLLQNAGSLALQLDAKLGKEIRTTLDNEVARIERISKALNGLQAYTYLAEVSPEHSLLRPYQIPFMRDICDFFEAHSADKVGGHAVIPTGVGKTVIFNEVIQATGLRTLVAADTNEQVKQNHDKLFEHARGRDISAGIVDGKHKEVGDDVTYTTYASLLMEVRKPPEQRIVKPEEYDMIIFDEAHLFLGENRRTVLSSFEHAIKMGFTATDRYTDEKQVSVLLPVEITRMTLEEAEDKKLVAPHHNIIVQTNMDMRRVPVASTGDYAQDILFETINTDERNLVAVETYMKLHLGKKVVNFCGGIEHAKDLARMYNEHGIPAAAVWGDMSEDEQKKIFRKFRIGELLHLTTAKLINTGFDMKSVECVYMHQPSLSVLQVIQGGGRSNRLWEEMPNKVSYIVQFIDAEYVQPPVIFAESIAAGHAQHGWDGFVFPEIKVTDLPYPVISDPVDVEWIALQHSEGRYNKNSPPPSGWGSFDDLHLLSGRPMNHLKKAYKDFCKELEENDNQIRVSSGEHAKEELVDFYLDEHTGTFLEPKKDGARKRYFSPDLILHMSRHLKEYRVKESDEWRRPAEIGAIFDKSTSWVNNTLLWRVRGKPGMKEYEAKLVESPGSARRLLHFHTEMVRQGIEIHGIDNMDIADLTRPPDRMQDEETVMMELDDEYGSGTYELLLSRSYLQPLGQGNTAGSIVYDVGGEKRHYYTPFYKSILKKNLFPNSGGYSFNRELPLYELVELNEMKRCGVTIAMIKREAENLLKKGPHLRHKLGLYINEDTGSWEYYGTSEIRAHVYERLLRSQLTEEPLSQLIDILTGSELLKKSEEDTAIPRLATPAPDMVEEEFSGARLRQSPQSTDGVGEKVLDQKTRDRVEESSILQAEEKIRAARQLIRASRQLRES